MSGPGAALPERWEPPEHDTAGTANLPAIAGYIERSRRALAVMEYVEDAVDAERRAAKLMGVAKLAEWPTPIINQAVLLQAEALARTAELVNEGQARGEIATPGGNQALSEARTLRDLGVDRRRLAEGRALARSRIIEKARAQVEREPDKRLPMNDLVRRAERITRDAIAARKREERTKREAKIKRVPPPDIRLGNFTEVLADVRDVDLVFTDPPYLQEFLPLWSDLSAWAAQALKPGALLVAYSGQYHLPEVIARLCENMAYGWTGWLDTPGNGKFNYNWPVQSGGKTLLFFSNGSLSKVSRTRRFRDKPPESRIAVAGDLHKWQQNIDAALYYIEALTERGELVADPFLGSGTFALAAQNLGRRFVGAEIDPTAFETTRERLA